MSCGPPLSVEGGQDAEMPSQGEKMSCEPPLNGQGGQEKRVVSQPLTFAIITRE